MTLSTRKKPGHRSDNEGRSKSSSGRKQTTKQWIEKAKNALMSSGEENDNVERKQNNNIAVIQAKNKELEADIEVLNEKDKDWEALNADNVGVISELRERVATLNKIASNLEAEVRVAQGQAHHAQNNGVDTTIERDAVAYDRVCSYVRKTMFRK
eukprot:scaffold9144_cov30-Attheya_sp.AAC.2